MHILDTIWLHRKLTQVDQYYKRISIHYTFTSSDNSV
jgi:hypothetical protein